MSFRSSYSPAPAIIEKPQPSHLTTAPTTPPRASGGGGISCLAAGSEPTCQPGPGPAVADLCSRPRRSPTSRGPKRTCRETSRCRPAGSRRDAGGVDRRAVRRRRGRSRAMRRPPERRCSSVKHCPRPQKHASLPGGLGADSDRLGQRLGQRGRQPLRLSGAGAGFGACPSHLIRVILSESSCPSLLVRVFRSLSAPRPASRQVSQVYTARRARPPKFPRRVPPSLHDPPRPPALPHAPRPPVPFTCRSRPSHAPPPKSRRPT